MIPVGCMCVADGLFPPVCASKTPSWSKVGYNSGHKKGKSRKSLQHNDFSAQKRYILALVI